MEAALVQPPFPPFNVSVAAGIPSYDDMLRRFGRVAPEYRGRPCIPRRDLRRAHRALVAQSRWEVALGYVWPVYAASYAVAIETVGRRARRPAFLEEAVAFVDAFPGEPLRFPIAVLGSCKYGPSGGIFVPVMRSYASGKRLRLAFVPTYADATVPIFPPETRFLVVEG